MKIKPMKKYRIPDYPSMVEAQLEPGLLSRIPRRWETSPGFAAMLGLLTGFATRGLMAGDGPEAAADTKVKVTQAPVAPRLKATRPDMVDETQRATSVVAPLLAEALKNDGRGAFGCVAMNPPTFLSEDEALELIRVELEAAGLKLKDHVELDNVEAPAGGGSSFSFEANDEDDGAEGKVVRDIGRGRAPKLRPRNFTFDLADTDRSIYIEYLSAKDHRVWAGSSMSTVSVYDFPEVAERVSRSLQKRTSDKRAVFGIFFDPLARAELRSPETSSLTKAQQRLAAEEFLRAMKDEHEHLKDKAREKLRKQVQNFVAFLGRSGVIETSK